MQSVRQGWLSGRSVFNGARKKERPDGSDAAGLSSSRGRGLEPCHAVGLSPGECAARLSSTSLLGQQRGAASSRRTDLRRSGAGATALTGGNDWWWASDADQAGNAGISGKSDRSSSGRDTQQAGRQSGRDAEQAGRHSRQESRTREGWPAARSSTWASRRAGGGGSSSSRSSSGRGQWENSGGRRRPEGRQWPQDAQSSQRDGVPYADDDSSSNERGSGSRGLASMWIGDVVYGVSPVLAALQAGRREVHTLYIQEGLDLAKRKDKGAIQAATKRAQELGANIGSAPKHQLNLITDNRPHQGLVLDASPLTFAPMEAFPEATLGPDSSSSNRAPPVWLCLDEVMDPQNFGAALRCAYFLGASGVLTCHRNSSPLTSVVSKASAGAMELLPVHSCRSLLQTLGDAKAKGWMVVGAAAEEGAVSCSTFHLTQPTILVMGNEGYGLRTTVRRLCDATLRIDGAAGGAPALVDSLNVSVATGILLHQLLASAAQELT